MPPDRNGGTVETLAPDEAFGVLANDTRMDILRALADADGALAFSELRDRVGIRQGAQFNYHLDKLVGHFVAKTDDGYALRQAGQRVVEAVLSGAVTEAPVLEPTEVEHSCPYCGAPNMVSYHEERVERYCTECNGLYDPSVRPESTRELAGPEEAGFLGALSLPPAGVQNRAGSELLDAALTWGYLEFLAMGSGVCPRCSGRVDHSLDVCAQHDAGDGICGGCHRRQAIGFRSWCRNCGFSVASTMVIHLMATTELLAFVTAHGYNPLTDEWVWGWGYEEEVLSTDPFEGRFTFTIDGDALTLTVDEELTVVEATRH